MYRAGHKSIGGRGGIRTHGTLAGTPVFKTGALNHSATLPLLRHQALGGQEIKNGLRAEPSLGPTIPQDPGNLTVNGLIVDSSPAHVAPGQGRFRRLIVLMASRIVAGLSFTKIGRLPADTALFASGRV
jgi:hypothetical protein